MPLQRAYLGCLVAAAVLGGVSGHGYVKSPVSRAYGCSSQGRRLNQNCGAVQYEPQSVEGPDGWPSRGPADGAVASAGLGRFSSLNEQSSTRWGKVALAAGPNTFTWGFTAPHVTRNFRYYITRVGWDADAPLGRASFEAAPFCTLDYGLHRPPMQMDHHCTVPSREGYHVILAVWEVGDTAASFYNVIDVLVTAGQATQPPVTTEAPTQAPAPGASAAPADTASPTVTPTPAPTPAQTSTPAPTPLPTQGPSAGPQCAGETLPLWSGCLQDPACCEAGTMCFEHSKWYAQCRRTCSTLGGSTCRVLGGQAQTRAPQVGTCATERIAKWGACLGKEACCAKGLVCTGNQWWKACK